MKTSYLYLVSGLLSAAMLVGCGGSGGGGTTSVAPTAEITDANKTDLAVAATEAAKSATTADAPTNLGFKSTVAKVANKAHMLPNQELVPDICTTGSVDATGLDSYTATSFSIDMTFNNCVIDDYYETARYNGSASVTSNSNGISISYNNFSVTVGGETTSINGTLSCDSNYLNCTENLTYGGDIPGTYSNTTYTTSNMQVSGDASGYNVNGSVTHPDHGTVTISATGVTFNCAGGYPGGGEITVTASGGVTATVTFNDCDSFTINYNGATTTVFWNTL